jgi:hypothetical protein
MQTRLIRNFDELARFAQDWDRLAGTIPFRCWSWVSHWWRSYGQDADPNLMPSLAVVAVFDEREQPIGFAPFYFDYSMLNGRTLRMLGDGKVCSDYQSLLCLNGTEESVAHAVAEFLLNQSNTDKEACPTWDLMMLDGVDFEDRPMRILTEYMGGQGCIIRQRSTVNCWCIDLPPTWDEYVNTLSKSYQRQVRQMEQNYFETGRAKLHVVEHLDDLPQAMDRLVSLHQRRRKTLGEAGCFSSPKFTAFYYSVLPQLLQQGRLKLFSLEIDGQIVAMEMDLAGGGVIYDYQGGIDPDSLKHQPGKLINLSIIRHAIEQGCRAFDFLRGDEPYKAHFRASPRPNMEIRVVPCRTTARIRQNIFQTGRRVKGWLKKRIKK